MIPFGFVTVSQTPFVARDAALTWRFPGTVKVSKGKYDLKGQGLNGEVYWFLAPKGKYDAEKLYKSDTLRTKEADSTKGFMHVRTAALLGGIPAIRSDQRYLWNGVPVLSRCVYAVDKNRAWVVRLWWSPKSVVASAAATLFLASVKKLP